MNKKLNDAIDELAGEVENTMPDKLLRTVTKELIANREKLYKIQSWCEAFPFSDFEKANKVLKNIQEIIDD